VATSPVLELKDVSKRYGEVEALSGVSFSVGSGESVGYLGPNGAGKSTTLKLLTGLSRPDAGTVLVGGEDPLVRHGAVMARVGVLVETPGVLPYLTGNDLLEYIAEVKRLPRGDRPGAIRVALDAMDVRAAASRPLGSLSTGLQRRVQLAGALVGDPRVLVLDEPTMGLDPIARTDLRVILRRLGKEGRTVLLSTHLLDDVEEVCQRVLFLKSGRLVGDEPVRDGGNAGRVGDRTLRLSLLRPCTVEQLIAILGEEVHVELPDPREALVRFQGAEDEQSEIIRRLAAGGVPITSTALVGSELARRYLARVGREAT
jgi:ABC-2 type transport system ATP-binding protein